MNNKILLICFLLTIVGCASRPESIPASHVSHEKYIDNDCEVLYGKLSSAQSELARYSDLQNSAANSDAVGVFLLGIPFSKLSGDHAGNVAKWKGEIEAIETAKIKNKCNEPRTAKTVKTQSPEIQTTKQSSIEERLRQLNNLKKDGIISDEEYQSKKRELLDKI